WRIGDLNAAIIAGRALPSELNTSFDIFGNSRELGGGTSVYVAKNPPIGTLGSEAGFRVGDRILSLTVAGKRVTDLAAMKNYLNKPIAGKEILTEVGRRAAELPREEKISLQTPVSHDPLWTFYPRQDGNWVLWTPEGNFDAPPEML